MNVETYKIHGFNVSQVSELQLSHVHMNVETGLIILPASGDEIASIEPRSYERGNETEAERHGIEERRFN